MLTVLEYDKSKGSYKCLCDCGNITYPNNKMLLHGASISCGCSKIKYLPGQKINNIELLERIDSIHWKCRCHCGKEFNGDYWHSEFYKSINNHAYKQKACRVQGINLIHLYEHEFEDQQIKDKCIALVRCALNDESNIDLTDIEVKIIDSQTAENFIADNSLYEYRDGCINIGLADKAGNTKILAQVSKSDNKATIYNITWDIKLTGGVQKLVQMLMTSIIKLINLDSLEVILNFDKLSWIKMGQQFKDCQILQPGYVWINTEGHKIKVINHTKCKEMIENNEIQTEDDLYRLNYCKLYNSGYLKYIWSI